jgi:hypothetical protein
MSNSKKQLWQSPWGYIESFLIIIVLLLGAILFELIQQKPAPTISWPINIIFVFFFAGLSINLHILSKKYKKIAWFSSIPASIGAIILFVSVSLFMALIPQNPQAKSLYFIYNVTQSWAYYIAIFYFLIVLGMVTIKRLYPINHRNIGFALNHLGLWITLSTASLGAGDMQKYTMELHKDKLIWYAYDKNMQAYDMDFSIKLNNFSIDEYPSKIAFVQARTGEFLIENGKKAIIELDTIHPMKFRNLLISVQKYYKSSSLINGGYISKIDYGTTQSCYVSVTNTKTHKTINGWIGSGSVSYGPTYLILEDSVIIALLQPEAKKFSSDVTIYSNNGKAEKKTLEVNKPIKINSWKVYQTSYDERKGKWSEISIVEIVKDPWLPFVYVGLFLMILGALYLIWFGRKK